MRVALVLRKLIVEWEKRKEREKDEDYVVAKPYTKDLYQKDQHVILN